MAYASGYPLQGRLTFQGLRVSIEQKKGTYREEKAHVPPRWRTKMCCHYGYILGSEGVDGDHVDCFIGPNPDAARAYIVRQVRPDSGAFDEQKVMLGFDTVTEAKQMYLKHYDTPKFFGGIRAMGMEEFKTKVLATLHGESLIKSLKTLPPDVAMVQRAQSYADAMNRIRFCWCGSNLGPDDKTCPDCGETYIDPDEGCPFTERNRKILAAHGLGVSPSLLKSIVEGHWRQTHGGGRVWIEPYKDKRIVHDRPKNEQQARPGDSLLLFPELGHVRTIKEPPKPKVAPPPVNQLSMFSEFKSLDAAAEGTPLPDLQYETPELRADLAACAMMAAHEEEEGLAHKMQLAAIRRAQAETVAAQFYGGLIGAENIDALRAVVALSPFAFSIAIRRLQEMGITKK
ncbi:zinc ribbon domain-containing protein [bacterium]|nr:MAG: zinc ribbon domain-containing protein [bacterium]